ncbi:hypothetical protein LINPERPRIM_LOCUS1069 [Linum perenne]
MGRRIPSPNDNYYYYYNLESPHPLLSLSLFIAGMVAIITITTTLCGYGAEKKLDSKSSLSPKSNQLGRDEISESDQTDGSQAESEDEDGGEKGLPLPPSKNAQLTETYSCNNFSRNTSVSRRNMSKAMSMNLKRSVSEAKKQYKAEKKERKKLKNEDSVWMKTIILGEKCKVPDDDEEDEEEETTGVLVDGKGRKVRAYHPRTMSSYALSRTNSSLDHTASQSMEGSEGSHHHDLGLNSAKKEEHISP